MKPTEAWLVDGPKAGECLAMEGWRDFLRVLLEDRTTYVRDVEPPTVTLRPYRTGMYRLRRDPWGFPAVDHLGRHLFDYQGPEQ